MPSQSQSNQQNFSGQARRALAWSTWVCVMVSLLTMAAFSAYSIYRESRQRAVSVAKVIAATAAGAVAFKDDAGAERLLSSLQDTSDVMEAKIVDREGKPVGAPFIRKQKEGSDIPSWLPIQLNDRAIADIIYEKEKLGEIHIKMNHRQMMDHLELVPLMAFCLLLLATLLILPISKVLQHRLAAPLNALVDVTRRVREEKNFALRAPRSDFEEFNQLSTDFNALLGEIETRSQELESTNKALARLAYSDGLTGLANRARFRQRVQELLHNATPPLQSFSIALIDLDGFKPVNDQCGHLVGDDVLVSVSRALERAVETSDMVARVGGDEFAILLHPLHDRSPQQIAMAAVEAVARGASRVAPSSLRVTASVGLAFFPEHGSTLDALLASADAAMYNAKNDGGARAHILPTTTTRMDARVR